MAEITYKGANIYFEVVGDGEKIPLVLLHGFLEDSRIWGPIVKELQTERQVICIDLPGHGRSQGIAEIHTMKLMAEVVREVLISLGKEKISIAGHSMGGYVSLELLRNFPMIIRSVMLINSTPLEDTVEKQEIRERSVKLVGRNKKAYISMAISNLYPERSKQKFAAEIEDLKSRAYEMKSKNIQAALKGMKIRTNYLEKLKAFTGQKIIAASKEDPILDFNELQRLSEGCDCEFLSLENGHNSYMEDLDNLTKKMHFID
ncbi:pimeloyl-ACP methyl ester carboxylesterase [Christiangramia gaetbulicola]|uniref:Pimeloyl-ACP methyl ester carboxylesterase n=1 Tax=Christiangramia gaetbulicola TaxID=703340 RepID=A0A2T6AN02_9FLAO|nr:alpha/beta hydrolase [Christiangramia gaetbulicola]PTX45201.1 pimeloyl-ACP methyl ester carboxylesterase [Christiangramia gaetbulicola]